jgi:hypothetical protein
MCQYNTYVEINKRHCLCYQKRILGNLSPLHSFEFAISPKLVNWAERVQLWSSDTRWHHSWDSRSHFLLLHTHTHTHMHTHAYTCMELQRPLRWPTSHSCGSDMFNEFSTEIGSMHSYVVLNVFLNQWIHFISIQCVSLVVFKRSCQWKSL